MMPDRAVLLSPDGFSVSSAVSCRRSRVKVLPALLFIALSVVAAAATEEAVDSRVETLLARMNRVEKIGQLQLLSIDGPTLERSFTSIRSGQVGGVLNSPGPEESRRMQRIATTESRLGIPLLFGRDVIHGFRTVFPIPLALAASWDPAVMESAARISAIEARSAGVNWTFAPMLDVTRDPRWGRVAESPGEDPHLGAVFARAMVRGFQGERLDSPDSLAACVKHFAGYGASEGGRDYNTTWIPDQQLHEVYLPPYQAGIGAGAATVMTAFNNLNGTPCPASTGLFRDLLREQWKFDGFVVSDWNSLSQLLTEGIAADGSAAARLAASAGVNMEMVTEIYHEHLGALLDTGAIKTDVLDGLVREILRVKFRMGLFEPLPESPHVYSPLLAPEHLEAAKKAAIASTVLLKNERVTLPLGDSVKSIAVLGPLADSGADQLGTWSMDGLGTDAVTPLAALRCFAKSRDLKVLHAPGLAISRTRSREGFAEALTAAKAADVTLLFVGEEAILSGEAHSRANLDLPGAQEALIREVTALGKPVVLIVMAGRPLVFGDLLDRTAAVLYAWHPGTMAGPALTDILFGVAEPTGRLPITFPKATGQIPIYYAHRNTGRPFNPATFVSMSEIPVGAPQSSLGNESHYLDLGHEPAFPFGFGLGYTTFALSDLKIDAAEIEAGATTKIRAILENTGGRRGTAVIQLYIHDRVADITRPLKELKDWSRVALDPGKKQELCFDLTPAQLSYPDAKGARHLEPGLFDIFLGTSSATTESVPLTVTGSTISVNFPDPASLSSKPVSNKLSDSP